MPYSDLKLLRNRNVAVGIMYFFCLKYSQQQTNANSGISHHLPILYLKIYFLK